ncbi:MAG TPA: hypothetical protein VNM16_12200 [Bacillota bacterium]|nr:hypothetical protein [Bacillota bacterium]
MAALAAGCEFAAPGGGTPASPRELNPDRIRAWAEALVALHAVETPEDLPEAGFPDWLARVPQPWPVDVAPLLMQASGMRRIPGPPAGGLRFCHRRWWLQHARFQGDALLGMDGWGRAARGDPAGDVASVLPGLAAAGASAAVAESFATAFATAYAQAGGAPLRGLGAWHIAWVGEELVEALRERSSSGRAVAEVFLWSRLLGRLLARRQD